MKKSKREKLADGIIDKLIKTFYTKKADNALKKMGGIDPDLAKQAKRVQDATDDLKNSIMSYRKERNEFARKNGIKINSDGSLDADDMLNFIKKQRGVE